MMMYWAEAHGHYDGQEREGATPSMSRRGDWSHLLPYHFLQIPMAFLPCTHFDTFASPVFLDSESKLVFYQLNGRALHSAAYCTPIPSSYFTVQA